MSSKRQKEEPIEESGYNTDYTNSTYYRLIMDNGSHKLRYSRLQDANQTYVECLNTVAVARRSSDMKLGTKVSSIMKENLYKYTNPHTRGILTNFDT